jgi:glutathione S-transferase
MLSAMKATLLRIPGSHPSFAAELMLKRKGIEVHRIDLVAAIHKPIVRAAGFPAPTVPAVFLDGQRLQGTATIARALDVLVPEPPLWPRDPERREAVERAERWGDIVLQPAARRTTWSALTRDRSTLDTFLVDAHLGIPTDLAVRTAGPVVWLASRFNHANDAALRRDLAALPDRLDHVDALIAEGVIGGDEPNVADYQIATSVRLLLALDDLKPAIESRPAGRHALAVVPEFPGRIPAALPAELVPRAA